MVGHLESPLFWAKQVIMMVKIAHRPFSLADYARLRKTGILTEDERVELIDGEIRQMAPIGPLHAGTVKHLNMLIARQLGSEFTISVQDPVELSEYNEPQPDLAVLQGRADHYKRSHPKPSDVLLVIEVADELEEYDREEKIPRYAASGIPEAWLVAVRRATVEQYGEPRNGRYRSVRFLEPGDLLICQSGPSVQLPVKDLFQ